MREEVYGAATVIGAQESVLLTAIDSAHNQFAELEVQIAKLSDNLGPVKVERLSTESTAQGSEPSGDSIAVQRIDILRRKINTLTNEIVSLKDSLQV